MPFVTESGLPDKGGSPVNLARMPVSLQRRLAPLYSVQGDVKKYLAVDQLYTGDARSLLKRIEPNSIAVSVWSPPYFVGKSYESYLDFTGWQELLAEVIRDHFPIITPGGFLVVNIADILCFKDPDMPKVHSESVHRKGSSVTRADVLRAMSKNPNFNRYQIAALLGCSEQTVDRRLNGNNVRGGKYVDQTRVKIVGGLLEDWGSKAGFYLYDRRIWVKDPAWENSRWASLSYKAIDEFEYLYFFWKPGVTRYDRRRLTAREWSEWGSRAVWFFRSVHRNSDHEAKFPVELPLRIIRLLSDPDDVILDCFMGSGSTAIAAIRSGRHFIGMDIEREYTALARENIRLERESNAAQPRGTTDQSAKSGRD